MAEDSEQLMHHINTQDPNIQFTLEEPDQDGSLPFLKTKVIPGPNNTLITTAYRTPTYRDQYLHWDSNLFIAAKHSIYNTLAHRAKVVSSNQPSLLKKLNHIKMELQACHFPTWGHNYTPILPHTSPHTPYTKYTPTPPLPCFSGTILSKYPYLFI